MNVNRIHDVLTRTAVVVTTTGLAALALLGPAEADVIQHPIGVSDCKTTNEVCHGVAKVRVSRDVRLIVYVETFHDQCSDIIANLSMDGFKLGSSRIAPGQGGREFGIPAKFGEFSDFLITADGIPGGCNTGTLPSWNGALVVAPFVP